MLFSHQFGLRASSLTHNVAGGSIAPWDILMHI
jgi:hypothetical protein